RCKAHQHLDSPSSQYQNALPSLIQKAAKTQLKKQQKKYNNSKVHVSTETNL
ncbi:1093_t:CDS:1, partial [Rhizophagus irregularis]